MIIFPYFNPFYYKAFDETHLPLLPQLQYFFSFLFLSHTHICSYYINLPLFESLFDTGLETLGEIWKDFSYGYFNHFL